MFSTIWPLLIIDNPQIYMKDERDWLDTFIWLWHSFIFYYFFIYFFIQLLTKQKMDSKWTFKKTTLISIAMSFFIWKNYTSIWKGLQSNSLCFSCMKFPFPLNREETIIENILGGKYFFTSLLMCEPPMRKCHCVRQELLYKWL